MTYTRLKEIMIHKSLQVIAVLRVMPPSPWQSSFWWYTSWWVHRQPQSHGWLTASKAAQTPGCWKSWGCIHWGSCRQWWGGSRGGNYSYGSGQKCWYRWGTPRTPPLPRSTGALLKPRQSKKKKSFKIKSPQMSPQPSSLCGFYLCQCVDECFQWWSCGSRWTAAQGRSDSCCLKGQWSHLREHWWRRRGKPRLHGCWAHSRRWSTSDWALHTPLVAHLKRKKKKTQTGRVMTSRKTCSYFNVPKGGDILLII